MVTGKKAFEGEGQASLIHAIMGVDPPAMSTLQSMTPPALDHVVTTCLAKKPDDRWQSAGDLRRQLTWITEGGSQPGGAAPTTVAAPAQLPVWQRPLPLVVAALALVAVNAVAVWIMMRSTPSVPRVERFAISPPVPETLDGVTTSQDIGISPDGARVVYLASGGDSFQIYVRALDALTSTPLAGLNGPVFAPFVSADSAWVGFSDRSDGTLKKVSIFGGPPVTICRVPEAVAVRGAHWAEGDTVVFSSGGGLWRVSANGGEPEALTSQDGQVVHEWPHVLPGSRAVLFTIRAPAEATENAQIALLNLETNEQRMLVSGGSAPRYSPTGHIVYGISGTLRAVGFDLDRLEVTNPNPVPVLDGVVTKQNGAANFDVARDGSLVYIAGNAGGRAQRALVWVDRAGREEPLASPFLAYQRPRVSPDGARVAVDVADPEGADIWIHDVARGTETRLTTDPVDDRAPLWTPDGDRIVFASNRESQAAALFWKLANTPGDAERLMSGREGRGTIEADAWSPDGQALLFWDAGGQSPDSRWRASGWWSYSSRQRSWKPGQPSHLKVTGSPISPMRRGSMRSTCSGILSWAARSPSRPTADSNRSGHPMGRSCSIEGRAG